MYRIAIPNWRPATDNELINCHWRTKHKLKQSDAEMVACYARLADVPDAKSKRKVSLEITLCGRQKKTDKFAYCKSFLDGLVTARILVDDNDEFMEWGGVTWTRGRESQTVIVLEDVE